jgi:sugar phosphate isomerase/epimerase
MLQEIRELGFGHAELSHGIRISLLPGILEAVDAGEIRISSLHNFCPLPLGVSRPAPNLYRFSSTDDRERENAYRHSVRTIETAVRVKAPLVVLHLGSVEMRDYTEKLLELLGKDQRGSARYENLCAELLEKRERRKGQHLKHVTEMLHRLTEQAARYGIQLGVENREALEELPFETDCALLLRDFPEQTVWYWHDTGHAQIKENLGFIRHAMHVESLAGRLRGFHLHDVRFPGMDHMPPGAGMVDFAALKPFAKKDHIKVFEVHPAVPVEELKKGVAYLQALWGKE